MRTSPLLLVIIASILAGLLNMFSKDLLNIGFDPMQICACREGVTAIAFAVILLFYDRSAFKIRIKDLWIFIMFAAFNVASNVCVFNAQEVLPLEVAAVLEMTSPYFILVFAFFLFGDKITKMKVLAAFLAFMGCVFIVGMSDSSDTEIGFTGIIIGLLSGITLAAFTIGSKYTEERNYSENTTMFYFFLFSAILIAPLTDFGGIFEMASHDLITPLCIILMGLLCTLTPNYLVIYSIRRMDPATVSIVITASLIVSTLCGVLVFGDPFGINDVMGIILVLVAITILDPPKSLKERFPWLEGSDGQ